MHLNFLFLLYFSTISNGNFKPEIVIDVQCVNIYITSIVRISPQYFEESFGEKIRRKRITNPTFWKEMKNKIDKLPRAKNLSIDNMNVRIICNVFENGLIRKMYISSTLIFWDGKVYFLNEKMINILVKNLCE